MKIGTKIKQQRKKKGLTQKELASILGLGGVTTVASWEQGLSNPPAKRIPAIADALDISVSELLGNNDAKPKNLVDLADAKVISIPILGTIACGKPIFSEENYEGHLNKVYFGDPPTGELFALTCQGDSMAPYILDGDKVIVRKQETVENGEIAAVLINNEATLKTVKYVGDKTLLIPKNDAYDPLVLAPDNQNQVLGKVVSIIRDI